MRLGLRRRRGRRDVLAVDREAERAALAHFALHPYRAAVRLDDALNARQPDALARHVRRRCILSSSENEEDFADVLGVDPDAGIRDVELRLGAAVEATDADALYRT